MLSRHKLLLKTNAKGILTATIKGVYTSHDFHTEGSMVFEWHSLTHKTMKEVLTRIFQKPIEICSLACSQEEIKGITLITR